MEYNNIIIFYYWGFNKCEILMLYNYLIVLLGLLKAQNKLVLQFIIMFFFYCFILFVGLLKV